LVSLGVGCGVTCGKLGLEACLEALDLSPLARFPLRDLDVGLGLQALDLGIGGRRLPGDFDLRHRHGEGRILRRLRGRRGRGDGGRHALGRLEEQARRLEAQRLGDLLRGVGDVVRRDVGAAGVAALQRDQLLLQAADQAEMF
jgi:hypothetical protein